MNRLLNEWISTLHTKFHPISITPVLKDTRFFLHNILILFYIDSAFKLGPSTKFIPTVLVFAFNVFNENIK